MKNGLKTLTKFSPEEEIAQLCTYLISLMKTLT